jgi:hypothetical protein
VRMTKQWAARWSFLITVPVILGIGAAVAAWWRSDIVLACRGTAALVQGGQQTNPKEEPMSLVVAVNLYRRTVKIDDDPEWPMPGDTSGNVLVAVGPNAENATLNRVTGTASIHRIVGGLEVFTGACVRAERLF